jgi:hypothetical protein
MELNLFLWTCRINRKGKEEIDRIMAGQNHLSTALGSLPGACLLL